MTSYAIKNTDTGAPIVSGTAGAFLSVLDAHLIVNRVFTTTDDAAFTDQSTEARLEAGTAFAMLPTPASGDRIYIGYSVPFKKIKFDLATVGVGGTYVVEYWNGSAWTSLTVTDGTSGFTADGTITWTIPGSWATNAVNSITLYWIRIRASANPSTNPTINYLTVGGWTRAFSGTNLAVYRAGTGSNGYLLRVDDTGTTVARCVGYESMTDINTGVNPSPSAAQLSGGGYWNKSSAASGAARPYVINFSEKLIYWFNNSDDNASSTSSSIQVFGEVKSYKSGDTFACIHIAGTSATTTANSTIHLLVVNTSTASSSGHWISRAVNGLGTSANITKHTDLFKSSTTATMGSAGLPYPNTADGGLYLAPLWLNETTTMRGEMPGIWSPMHNQPGAHYDTFSGSGDLAGKTFLLVDLLSSATAVLETSDTWGT